VEICATRDQKGIYKKAKAGVIKKFTGITAPYEPPENADLVIQSHKIQAKEAVAQVLKLIQKRQIILS
jgi:adenylylsulfate kinase-like enzyme